MCQLFKRKQERFTSFLKAWNTPLTFDFKKTLRNALKKLLCSICPKTRWRIFFPFVWEVELKKIRACSLSCSSAWQRQKLLQVRASVRVFEDWNDPTSSSLARGGTRNTLHWTMAKKVAETKASQPAAGPIAQMSQKLFPKIDLIKKIGA